MDATALRTKCNHVIRAADEWKIILVTAKDPSKSRNCGEYLLVELDNLADVARKAGSKHKEINTQSYIARIDELKAQVQHALGAQDLRKEAMATIAVLDVVDSLTLQLMTDIMNFYHGGNEAERAPSTHTIALPTLNKNSDQPFNLFANFKGLSTKVEHVQTSVFEWALFASKGDVSGTYSNGMALLMEVSQLSNAIISLIHDHHQEILVEYAATFEGLRADVEATVKANPPDGATVSFPDIKRLSSRIISAIASLKADLPKDQLHSPLQHPAAMPVKTSHLTTPSPIADIDGACSRVMGVMSEWQATLDLAVQDNKFTLKSAHVVITQVALLSSLVQQNKGELTKEEGLVESCIQRFGAHLSECRVIMQTAASAQTMEWTEAFSAQCLQIVDVVTDLRTNVLNTLRPFAETLTARTARVSRAVDEWGLFVSKVEARNAFKAVRYVVNEVDVLAGLLAKVSGNERLLESVSLLQRSLADGSELTKAWVQSSTEEACLQCQIKYMEVEILATSVNEEILALNL